jgi:hypothetical protein
VLLLLLLLLPPPLYALLPLLLALVMGLLQWLPAAHQACSVVTQMPGFSP